MFNVYSIFNNPLIDTDSYKSSHWKQVPPGTTSMFSYIESRGGEYKKTVFFGLKYILSVLSNRITAEHVEEADAFILHMVFHSLANNLIELLMYIMVHGLLKFVQFLKVWWCQQIMCWLRWNLLTKNVQRFQVG